MYLYVNRIKSLIKVVWTIFIVGILATAYLNNDHKQYFNCKTIYVPINANKDRQFTYEDIGAFALQITALPQKLLSNSSELKLLIDFLELKPNECAAPKGIMVSGTLFLILCLVAALLASFAFFGFRFFVKYLLLNALKIKRYRDSSLTILFLVNPKFVWLVPPKHLVFLCFGLTVILLLKLSSPAINGEKAPKLRVPAVERQKGGGRDRPAEVAMEPGRTSDFLKELEFAINSIRQESCNGKPSAQLLKVQSNLSAATVRMQTGSNLESATLEAGYRSVSSHAIKLGGHMSIASIQRLLRDQHCDQLMNSDFTELGVGGTVDNVTIVLAKPFVREIVNPASIYKEVVKLVNEARAAGGLCGGTPFPSSAKMEINEKLQVAAQGHAKDMAENNYYSHQSLDGRSAGDRIWSAGYISRMTAENIAAGQQSAKEVVTAWLKSPGHCRNIMNPDLHEIGIGVSLSQSSKLGIYWVQNFGAGEK